MFCYFCRGYFFRNKICFLFEWKILNKVDPLRQGGEVCKTLKTFCENIFHEFLPRLEGICRREAMSLLTAIAPKVMVKRKPITHIHEWIQTLLNSEGLSYAVLVFEGN